jgi:hypothetical protein
MLLVMGRVKEVNVVWHQYVLPNCPGIGIRCSLPKSPLGVIVREGWNSRAYANGIEDDDRFVMTIHRWVMDGAFSFSQIGHCGLSPFANSRPDAVRILSGSRGRSPSSP